MLGIGMLVNPGVFYSKDPRAILNDSWLLDQNKIENLKKHKLVILDFSTEHYGEHGLDYIYQELEESKLNFLLLSHNPDDHQKFDRMFFYPHWYHWAIKGLRTSKTADPVNKTYKWSCLNAVPRPHRIYNYIYSRKQPYFNDSIFTFHNIHHYDPRNDDIQLDENTLNEWNQIKDSLPFKKILGSNTDSASDLPANSDSYVHLVTETTICPKIFMSEKTWKPIASGQFFLIFGNPGAISYLRNQGVDVFDDIIDHSYDHTLDWQTRLEQIHKQIEKLVSKNLNDLYINTHSRRQANIQKFLAGKFDEKYLPTITQCINTLS
mgnify:CR=1 FL=1